MADWEALNQNIGSFSSALGEEAKMQRMKQMEMESSIQLAIAKARLEQLVNQSNPMFKFEQGSKVLQFLKNLDDMGIDVSQDMGMFTGGSEQPQVNQNIISGQNTAMPSPVMPTLNRLPMGISPTLSPKINTFPSNLVESEESNMPTSMKYDRFGRPTETQVNILDRQKFDVEQQEKSESKIKQEQQVMDSAKATLDSILEIKKGIRYFGAMGGLPAFPAEYSKQNWSANLDRLRGRLVLDLMNTMKQASKTGATGFGQLSEKELKILQDSATALKSGLSEEDALRYLNQIEKATLKVIKGGYIKTGVDKDTGKRVGMKEDGSVEYID